MTEDQARAALRAFVAVGGLEAWIADQPWLTSPSGWVVPEPFQDLRFRVEPVAGGVRVVMCGTGGQPADWTVPAR